MLMKLCPKCEATYTGSFAELHYLACDALRAIITAHAIPEWFNANPDPQWKGWAPTGPATFTREDLEKFINGATQAAVAVLSNREREQ
jgi:hypothetical protein